MTDHRMREICIQCLYMMNLYKATGLIFLVLQLESVQAAQPNTSSSQLNSSAPSQNSSSLSNPYYRPNDSKRVANKYRQVLRTPKKTAFKMDTALEWGRLVNADRNAEPESDSASSYLYTLLVPRYEFGGPYVLGAQIEATVNQLNSSKPTSDFDLVRPYFRFLQFKLASEVTTATTARVTLPANSTARISKTYQGALSLAQSLTLTKWNFSAALSVQQYYHEKQSVFDEDSKETFNTDRSLGLELKKSFQFTNKISLDLQFLYVASRAYDEELKEKFTLIQGLNYDLTPKFGFYGAHALDRPLFVYDDNGNAKNNFAITSPEESILAIGVYYNL